MKWPIAVDNIKMLHHRKAKEASNAKRKRGSTYHAKQEGERERASSDSTKRRLIIKEEKEICSICMDPITCRGLLAVCNHSFCFDCIYEWSKMTNRCPLCKGRFRCISKINLKSFSPEKQFRVKDCDQKLDVTAEDFELALELENDVSVLEDRDSDYQMESENDSNSSENLTSIRSDTFADANDSNDSFVTTDDSITYCNDSFACYDDSFIDDADLTQHPSNFSLASCLEKVNKEWHFPYGLRTRTKSSVTTTQSNSPLNYSPMLTRSKSTNKQHTSMETGNLMEGSTSFSMQRLQRAQHMQAENEKTNRNAHITTNNLSIARNSKNMQPQINKEEKWSTLEENDICSSSDDDMQLLKSSRKQLHKCRILDDSLDVMTDNTFDDNGNLGLDSTDDLDNEALNHSNYDEVSHFKTNETHRYYQKRDLDYYNNKSESKGVTTSQSVAMISCLTEDSTMENWKSRDNELEIHSLNNEIFADKENDGLAKTLSYRSKLRINPQKYKNGCVNSKRRNSKRRKRSINKPDYKDTFIYSSDEENCFHPKPNYERKNRSKDLEDKYNHENWDVSCQREISLEKKSKRLGLPPNRRYIPCGDMPIMLQSMSQSAMSQSATDTAKYCANSKPNGEKRKKTNWQCTVAKREVKMSKDFMKSSNDEKFFCATGMKEAYTSDNDILDTDEETRSTNVFVPRRQKSRFHTIVRRKQNTRMPRYDF